MVGTDEAEVERVLRVGLLECDCGGRLRPWGWPVSEVSDELGRGGPPVASQVAMLVVSADQCAVAC